MSSVVEFTAPKVGVIVAIAKQLYAVTLLGSPYFLYSVSVFF